MLNNKVHPSWSFQAHLLARQPAEAHFTRVTVMVAAVVVGAAALCSLQGLQVLQGSADAKGGAVEVSPPELKGEQEFAGQHQLPAPGRQGPPADGQHVLCTIQHSNLEKVAPFHTRAWRRLSEICQDDIADAGRKEHEESQKDAVQLW